MLLAFLTTVYSSPYIRKLETDGCVDNPDFNCELYAYKWDCNYNAKVMLACPAKCQERGYRDCGVSDGCVDKANFDCATRAFEWHCQNDEEVMSSCCFTCRVNSGQWGGEETTTKAATSTTKVATSTTKVATSTTKATTSTTKFADAVLGYCTIASAVADPVVCINIEEEFKCNDFRDENDHKTCRWKPDQDGTARTSGTCSGDPICKYAKNSFACKDLENYGRSQCEWNVTDLMHDFGYCAIAASGVPASVCIKFGSHDECNNSTYGGYGRPCLWQKDESGKAAMPGTCVGDKICDFAKSAFACNGLKLSGLNCEWKETD